MLNMIRRFVKEEEGAAAAEYALLMAMVAALIATAVVGLRDQIITAVNGATANIATANGS